MWISVISITEEIGNVPGSCSWLHGEPERTLRFGYQGKAEDSVRLLARLARSRKGVGQSHQAKPSTRKGRRSIAIQGMLARYLHPIRVVPG